MNEKNVNKYCIEPPEFKKNDKVWISSTLIIKNSNKNLKSGKLGPFNAICKISLVSYKLDLQKNIRIHLVIYVSEFEPYCEDRFWK